MIDEALWVSSDVLRRGAPSRADRREVVILLSDGSHQGAREDVRVAAEALRRSGAWIFAIGLGEDSDAELLQSVADPGRYYSAADGVALEAIYRSIAVAIPCN
jgi:hypothetical protein